MCFSKVVNRFSFECFSLLRIAYLFVYLYRLFRMFIIFHTLPLIFSDFHRFLRLPMDYHEFREAQGPECPASCVNLWRPVGCKAVPLYCLTANLCFGEEPSPLPRKNHRPCTLLSLANVEVIFWSIKRFDFHMFAGFVELT